MLQAGLIASRFLQYSSVLLLFGAALFPVYGFGKASSVPGALRGALKRMLLLAVLVAFFSLLAWFLFAAGTMAGSAGAMVDHSVLMIITDTMGFGHLWVARLALTAILAVILARWPSPISYWSAPPVSALLLASLAGTGHAQETQGAAGAWHVFADGAHLLAAGAWLGALWPLAFELRTKEPDADQVGPLLLRFSSMGQIAVAVLLLSGVVNSWFLAGSFGQLATTFYGQLLSLKIVLFLSMLAFAAVNRFWITTQFVGPSPPPDRALWLARLRKHIVAEQALGLLVLAVVSLLGTLQPAAAS
jgi:putative copper resistance protein D